MRLLHKHNLIFNKYSKFQNLLNIHSEKANYVTKTYDS